MVLSGDDSDTFSTSVTEERHCGLVLAKPLDFEAQTEYRLSVGLVLPPAGEGVENRIATVRRGIASLRHATSCNENIRVHCTDIIYPIQTRPSRSMCM